MKTRGQVINTLYRLKMDFGIPATLKNIGISSVDFKTGEMSKTYESVDVRRAILLPNQSAAAILYNLSASRNFDYGGLFKHDSRTLVIDGKDIPRIFEITLQTLTIFQGKTYSIRNDGLEILADGIGYLLNVGATNE